MILICCKPRFLSGNGETVKILTIDYSIAYILYIYWGFYLKLYYLNIYFTMSLNCIKTEGLTEVDLM